MDHTVDGIAECVRSLLASVKGEEQTRRFNQLVADVDRNIPMLREIRAKLHQRARMQLYINVSDARNVSEAFRMSVRVHGCECGTVTIDSDGKRTFAPRNRRLFECYGYDEVRGLDWRDPRAAGFIKTCVDAIDRNEVKTGRPEARVEAELIVRMKSESGGWWCQKPVCLAGMPLQIPLPIAASGPEPVLGDGHIDVLARLGRGGKGLRVYEVKAPGARVESALDQAVAYAAALKFFLLMQTDSRARNPWWSLLGFSKYPSRTPRFEAVACIADIDGNRERLEAACQRLDEHNQENIGVDAVFYSRKSGSLELRPLKGADQRV